MNYTLPESELMDKIFNDYFFENKSKSGSSPNVFFYKSFSPYNDYSKTRYAINRMLKTLNNLDMVSLQTFDSGDYAVLSKVKHKIEEFKNTGGFVALYKKQQYLLEKDEIREKESDEKRRLELGNAKFQYNWGNRYTKWTFIIAALTLSLSILGSYITAKITNERQLDFLRTDTTILNTKLKLIDLRLRKIENQNNSDSSLKPSVKKTNV